MLSYNLGEDYFGIVEHIRAAFFPDHWSVDIMV